MNAMNNFNPLVSHQLNPIREAAEYNCEEFYPSTQINLFGSYNKTIHHSKILENTNSHKKISRFPSLNTLTTENTTPKSLGSTPKLSSSDSIDVLLGY